MGLYNYLVCILLPSISNIIDIPHSHGELAYFWQAERCARWSVARTLFMVVSSCTFFGELCLNLRFVEPLLPDHRIFPPHLLAREPIS